MVGKKENYPPRSALLVHTHHFANLSTPDFQGSISVSLFLYDARWCERDAENAETWEWAGPGVHLFFVFVDIERAAEQPQPPKTPTLQRN